MRTWLERIVPLGSAHLWLVDGVELAGKLLLILVLYAAVRWLAVRALDAVLNPLLARSRQEGPGGAARLETLAVLSRSSVRYALLFVLVVTLLSAVGIEITAILASAGVAGLAISFGAQRVVRDVLSGFFILLEDQFRVGEMVTLVNGPGLPLQTGAIVEMGLRVSRLTDLTGRLVTVANGDITTVVNHSRGPVTAAVEIGVPPGIPLARVQELAGTLVLPDSLFAGKAEVEGVAGADATRILVRVAAPAGPGMAPQAELALRGALADALRRGGIEIR